MPRGAGPARAVLPLPEARACRCGSAARVFPIRSVPRTPRSAKRRARSFASLAAHLPPSGNSPIGIVLRPAGSTSLKSGYSHCQERVENLPHATFSERNNPTKPVATAVLTARKARLIYHPCPRFSVRVTHFVSIRATSSSARWDGLPLPSFSHPLPYDFDRKLLELSEKMAG